MVKSEHNMRKTEPSVKQHLNRLDRKTREEMLAIWNGTEAAHRKLSGQKVSDASMEQALSRVHSRIAEADHPAKEIPVIVLPKKQRGLDLPRISMLLAASLAFFALGFGWMSHISWKQVPAGETLALTLPDGSSLTLNSGSEVGYNRLFGRTNRSLRLNGEGYFEVVSGDTPFRIRANDNVVEVLGTSFNLRSWSTDPDRVTTLSVTSGRVDFFRSQNPEAAVTLTAGQSSSLSDLSSIPAEPSQVQVTQALAWKNNQLAFSMQPLSVIFDELARKFNVAIEVNAGDIAEARLSIFYTEPDLETILAEICTVKGLEYSRTANGFRIHR